MNLDYNEEQIMLREQIQKFCESEYDFYKREEVIKSDKHFDAEVWKLFADQGWLSMPFSEESGGLGFGPIELSILFEEFGKALVIEPYLAIHEQNAKSGRANRYIAMFLARGVIEGLPGAFDWKTKLFRLSSDDHVFMGNPIRDEIINIYKEVRPFSEFSKNPRILVFGGSQGARKINQTIPKMLEKVDKEMNIEIIHQTGESDYQDVLASYEQRGLSANVMPFINDMAGAYEWADLVIGRSGAMTVSELSAIGMPSILIPYPHAMDNHQWFNAKFIADKSGAELILDKDLEPEMLAICIEKIFSDKDILVKMSKATFDQKFVDATKNITQFCYKMIQQPPLKNLKDFSM